MCEKITCTACYIWLQSVGHGQKNPLSYAQYIWPCHLRAAQPLMDPPLPLYVVVRSQLPTTALETFISLVTREVHTEYILLSRNAAQACVSYTIFVGGKVTMEITKESSLLSDNFKNVLIEVSPSEMEDVSCYFSRMVNKVGYNWFDSRCLLPLFRPSRDNVFVEDVDESMDPSKLGSVFCSQMGVLALRNALRAKGENGQLVEDLRNLNSRLTSPHTLYSVVKLYGHEVDGVELSRLVDERKRMG